MSKRILIFDDDEDILAIASYILEEQGWDVTSYSECSNIIEKVSALMPDVILMDNWIPDSGGKVATQTLKSTADPNHIPVIYFSANSDIAGLAKEAGADAYLEKPFDLTELEKVVNSVVLK